jgi:hypothetical protein
MNEKIRKIINELGLEDDLNHLDDTEKQSRTWRAIDIWIQANESKKPSQTILRQFVTYPVSAKDNIEPNLFDNSLSSDLTVCITNMIWCGFYPKYSCLDRFEIASPSYNSDSEVKTGFNAPHGIIIEVVE